MVRLRKMMKEKQSKIVKDVTRTLDTNIRERKKIETEQLQGHY